MYWANKQTLFPGGIDALFYRNFNFGILGVCLTKKQNRSTEGCSKLKRSVDMTSSILIEMNNNII